MQSFTFGSDEYYEAVIREGIKDKYPIELNATDFLVFIKILDNLSKFASVSHSDFPVINGYGDDNTEPIEEWARNIYSSIGETLGIEGI